MTGDCSTTLKLDKNMTIDPTAVRSLILEQSKRANVGHIGSCLSVVDILCALYSGVLRGAHDDPDRDRFVMSKGHAALALYCVLHLKGIISKEQLDSFCEPGSLIYTHPDHRVPGVDFSTGSLGMGLGYACGAALAARMQGSKRRVYCLISDGELNEGSTWEAIMFAAHNKLNNLTCIVDYNGQQAMGLTKNVSAVAPMLNRWLAFGWFTSIAECNDAKVIKGILPSIQRMASSMQYKPCVLLAETVFGKGVSFMEQGVSITQKLPTNPVNWHYLPMSDEEYTLAMAEIDKWVNSNA